MFLNTTGPLDLFDTVLRLGLDGAVRVGPRGSLVDAAASDERIVAAFHAHSDQAVHPDVWERHPAGEELLCVLSGTMNVYLRDPSESDPVVTVTAGEAFVIPRDAWHRLSVVCPGELLSLTPPAGTEHEPVTDDQPCPPAHHTGEESP